MKDRELIVAEKLTHALTFVRLAKDAKFAELVKQHLDEAERLIEYAKGILDEASPSNPSYRDRRTHLLELIRKTTKGEF